MVISMVMAMVINMVTAMVMKWEMESLSDVHCRD